MARSLARVRGELADFLRSRRQRIAPEAMGLPAGGRRRTPGLRREEVAALAGVGVTWYTWLEQGREIGVSSGFLDRLSEVLRLDEAERRHLYLLVHQRPPVAPGKTWCQVPEVVHRLMADLPQRPVYVLNLRWDVLAWNPVANRLFGFAAQSPGHRNLLRMLFLDPVLRQRLVDWPQQASQLLASFRRGFVQAHSAPDIDELVLELTRAAPDFGPMWARQQVHGSCLGVRRLWLPDLGDATFDQASLTIDAERHLHLVYYAARDESAWQAWLRSATVGEC